MNRIFDISLELDILCPESDFFVEADFFRIMFVMNRNSQMWLMRELSNRTCLNPWPQKLKLLKTSTEAVCCTQLSFLMSAKSFLSKRMSDSFSQALVFGCSHFL